MILELQLEIDKKDMGTGDLVGPNDNLFENKIAMETNPRDVEFAKNLEFEIYDSDNNLITTKKGNIGPDNRWQRFLYVDGLQRNQKYKIKVKSDTVPDGYTYWFHTQEPHRRRPAFQITDDEDLKNSTAIMDSNGSTEKYGFGVLRLGVFDIIFAKDEETAKKIYTFDEDKNNITGFNPELEDGKDYVKSRVTKDHRIDKPSDFHKEGLKPLYWYTETLDEEGQEKELVIDDDFELKGELGTDDRIRLTDDYVNNHAVVFKGRSYILKLKSTLPLAKFNKNDESENPEVIEQNIYYLKSLATNEISTGKIKNNVVTPTREGYVFKGWNTKADGSGQAFDENTLVTDDFLDKDGKFTVYAQWEKEPEKPVEPPVNPDGDEPSDPIYTPSDDYIPSTPTIDTDEDDGIKELIDEFKELDKEIPDNNSKEKPDETPSEKEDDNKENMTTPAKSKDQNGIKDNNIGKKANPKTGVTGSAAIAALGLSSIFASLGLRKKND